ncbi:hypothetical protein MAR_032370 [Mya arenaria]|uniref:Uncharacterized protein n=1 Tax=Mya arenaria TaxID=6604 RepID=A0ABY7F9V6_MYAAR|nr:hypothetical protein MAR_032370 [Mya arenaria]
MDASVYVILCCLVLGGDASGSCGALTIMKPTFVNRNVTLKFIPRNQRITNIVWKYTPGWNETNKHAVEGLKGRFPQAVQDGLTIYNFTENKAGHYALQCNRPKGFITNWLNINVTEKDSDHILNITEYIHDENRQIRTSFRQELTPISGDNSKRSFKVPFEPILIGTGTFVALCLFVASARTLVRWHKGRNRTR